MYKLTQIKYINDNIIYLHDDIEKYLTIYI